MTKCINHGGLRRHCWLAVVGLLLGATTLASAAIPLVKNGQSSFAIYCDPSAPQANRLAAQEIQRVIERSTGAKLRISDVPDEPMICLGDNPSLRKAGLSVDGLSDDGFRIVTKGQNIYIAGKDTADDEPVPLWHTSRGTLFGAYAFLEQAIDVRWLMPGDIGEDIPQHADVVLPDLSREESPDFPIRRLEYVQAERPEVQAWMLRHKLVGRGRKVEFGHAWDRYLAPGVLQAHPEYLAVDGEKNKFCTTNPDLIRRYAEGVLQWLEENPARRSASISASDGGGFCQCKNCQSLVRQDPHGQPSNTLMLLHFYNNVAKIVGKKMPDRIVGGLVYYNYMYPPTEPVSIEPNLYLQLAPLSYYGYGLYKPPLREEFEKVIAGWTALTPNFCYTNYSTWMRAMNGSPLPLVLDILKFEIPTLKRLNVKGAEPIGISAWGYGGVCNYILAKQLWNANTDVDAVFQEWLMRAYGPGWKSMAGLYALLDERMKTQKEKEGIQYRPNMYEVHADLIKELYVPILPAMEELYRDALAKTQTEAQRARLEMFGQNMVFFHYYLREAGLLNALQKSMFYRNDQEFETFHKEHADSLAVNGKDSGGLVSIYVNQWDGDNTIYLKDRK